MENKYTLEISHSFDYMLYQNLNIYILFSKSYTNLIHAKVYYTFELLKTFPYSFPKLYLDDINTNLRKFVIDRRFLIVYEIIDKSVKILYFVDGRRPFNKQLIY